MMPVTGSLVSMMEDPNCFPSSWLPPSSPFLSIHYSSDIGERGSQKTICAFSQMLFFFKLKNGQHYFNFYFCLPAIAKTAVIGNKSVNTFARAHSTAVPLTCTCVDSGVFSC